MLVWNPTLNLVSTKPGQDQTSIAASGWISRKSEMNLKKGGYCVPDLIGHLPLISVKSEGASLLLFQMAQTVAPSRTATTAASPTVILLYLTMIGAAIRLTRVVTLLIGVRARAAASFS